MNTIQIASSINNNGVTYYKKESQYEGDITKNCSLLGSEIDANFYFLRGNDIQNCEWVKDEQKLVLTRLNGNVIEIPIDSISTLSGTEYDAENGILYLKFNEDVYPISGFYVPEFNFVEKFNEIDSKFEDIDTKISTITDDIDCINTNLDTLCGYTCTEIERLSTDVDALESQVSRISGIIDPDGNINNAFKILEAAVGENRTNIEILNTNLNTLCGYTNAEIERLTIDVDDLKVKEEENRSDIESLNTNLDTLSGFTNTEIERITTDVNELEEQLSALTNRVDEAHEAIQTLQTEVEENRSNIEVLNTNLDTLSGFTNTEIERLTTEIDDLEDRVTTLSETLDNTNTALQNLQSEVETNRDNITTLTNNLDTLSGFTNTEIERLTTDVDNLKEQVAALSDGLDTANTNISSLQTEIEANRTNIETINANLETINNEIGRLDNDVDTLKAQVSELQGLYDPDGSDNNALKELQVQVNENSQSIENILEKLENVAPNISSYDNDILISKTITAEGKESTEIRLNSFTGGVINIELE